MKSLALIAAATVSLVSCAAALAGGQPGQTVEIDSQVKLRNSSPAFHGKVVSENANCVEQRKVKMFKLKRNGGKKLLGKGRADNAGKWTIPFDKLGSGAYMAVATRVEEGTAGTIYVCLRSKSKVLTVD